MFCLKKNKKALLHAEIFLIIISLIVVFLSCFFSFNLTSSTKNQILTSSPNLVYNFPLVFVNTFLDIKLLKSDVEKLSLDENQNYFIKDLIVNYQSFDEKEQVLINEFLENKKEEYISFYEGSNYDIYNNYFEFSKNQIDKSLLLKIEFGEKELESLDEIIRENNYYFYFLNKDNSYNVIYFQK